MNEQPTILEVMEHREMLLPFFKGDQWKPWKAFLAAVFGLPMDDELLAIYRAQTGRTTPPAQQFTEVAAVVGRRGGKSRILATIAIYLSFFRDYSPYLAPGEVPTIAVLAADRKQARTIFRYVTGMLDVVPSFAAMLDGAPQNESVKLKNGVRIEIATADYRSTRGYTYAAVLCDESAFWETSETGANPDEQILAAIRPGLATIPGAMLLQGSSPYAQRGALWRTWWRYYGDDNADVLVWQAPTLTMHPTLDASIIKRARENDPMSAAAEYDAKFRTDVAAFVDREAVDACVAPGRFELPRSPGINYVAFCDPSAGRHDSMTFAIAHRAATRSILDVVRERKSPFKPEEVVKEFVDLMRAYGIRKVVGDRFGGAWVESEFKKHGVDYIASEKSRSQIYLDFLSPVNSGLIELLDNKRLIKQICELERKTTRGGRDMVDHPPNGADDVINSAAGALDLCASAYRRPPLRISAAAVERAGALNPQDPWSVRHHQRLAMGFRE